MLHHPISIWIPVEEKKKPEEEEEDSRSRYLVLKFLLCDLSKNSHLNIYVRIKSF